MEREEINHNACMQNEKGKWKEKEESKGEMERKRETIVRNWQENKKT